MPGSASSPGAVLRELRRTARLTQRELATKAGVSVTVVRSLEQGTTTRPHPRSMGRLAATLGVLPAQLLTASVPAGSGYWDRTPNLTHPQEHLEKHYGVRIQVLGPLTVWHHGQPVPLGPPSQQAVLAILAAEPGIAVHRDAVVAALWGQAPPPTATSMLHTYLSRLRTLLDQARTGLIQRSGSGYKLRADTDVDVVSFRRLAHQARKLAIAGDTPAAQDRYEQALATWQGEPLAGISSLASHPVVIGLAREYAAAVLGYARLAAIPTEHERTLPYLHTLITRHPLDEQACAHLMMALAATGQRSTALAVYQQIRHRLDSELGILPGPALANIHTSILRGHSAVSF